MNKILAIVFLAACVAVQGKFIPERVDQIAFYPEAIKNLGLDGIPSFGPGSDKIIGGEVVEPNSKPWQVYLNINNGGFCGGSVLTEDWILTAAHCCEDIRSLEVVAGAHNISNRNEPTQQRVRLLGSTIIHPKWNSTAIQNDICVFRVTPSLTLNDNVAKSCLDNDKVTLTPGKPLNITGWGRTASGIGTPTSDVLKETTMKYISNEVCIRDFNYTLVIDSTLCCSTEDGQSTCNGDSGGPLVSNDDKRRQVGIVSFGTTFCPIGRPAGFARVASFFSWVLEATGLRESDISC